MFQCGQEAKSGLKWQIFILGGRALRRAAGQRAGPAAVHHLHQRHGRGGQANQHPEEIRRRHQAGQNSASGEGQEGTTGSPGSAVHLGGKMGDGV